MKEKEKKDTRLANKQQTENTICWWLTTCCCCCCCNNNSNIIINNNNLTNSTWLVKKVFQCKVETSSQALARSRTNKRREVSLPLHLQCSVSLLDLLLLVLLNTERDEREKRTSETDPILNKRGALIGSHRLVRWKRNSTSSSSSSVQTRERERESFTSQSLQSIKSIISPIFSVPPILVTHQELWERKTEKMGRR